MTSTETRRPTSDRPEPKGRTSVGAQLPHPANDVTATKAGASGGGPSNLSAIEPAETMPRPPAGPNSTTDQSADGAQYSVVGRGPISQQAIADAITIPGSPAGFNAVSDQPASDHTTSIAVSLADPTLSLAAEILDDTEKVWIANTNRLRILTTPSDQPDADGVCRGFGLTEHDKDVARLAALVAALEQVNKDATKHLEKVMRRHPLGPWQRDPARKGIGEKQLARLLAAIGDPYIRPEMTRQDGTVEPARPRRVSELWAYCGYHVLPAGQGRVDTQWTTASRAQAGGDDTGQAGSEAQGRSVGVAPRRQRNQQSKWSEVARMRAWNIANSVVKSGGPYREVYDATKAKYADAVHHAPCVRCGPAGKPAQPGTPLSKAHIHARGLRAIAKAVLKDLWIEARRLHLEAGGEVWRARTSRASEGDPERRLGTAVQVHQ